MPCYCRVVGDCLACLAWRVSHGLPALVSSRAPDSAGTSGLRPRLGLSTDPRPLDGMRCQVAGSLSLAKRRAGDVAVGAVPQPSRLAGGSRLTGMHKHAELSQAAGSARRASLQRPGEASNVSAGGFNQVRTRAPLRVAVGRLRTTPLMHIGAALRHSRARPRPAFTSVTWGWW